MACYGDSFFTSYIYMCVRGHVCVCVCVQTEKVAIIYWPHIGDHSGSYFKDNCVRSLFLIRLVVKKSVR
jgi:hypothetical protein